MSAEYQVRGEVAVITLNNPPVNGLGYDTRKGLTDALERANAEAAVKAIVITGAGKAFSGGADIKEFGTPKSPAGSQPAERHPGRRELRQARGGGYPQRLHGRRAWNWRWAATTVSPRRAATWRCPR